MAEDIQVGFKFDECIIHKVDYNMYGGYDIIIPDTIQFKSVTLEAVSPAVDAGGNSFLGGNVKLTHFKGAKSIPVGLLNGQVESRFVSFNQFLSATNNDTGYYDTLENLMKVPESHYTRNIIFDFGLVTNSALYINEHQKEFTIGQNQQTTLKNICKNISESVDTDIILEFRLLKQFAQLILDDSLMLNVTYSFEDTVITELILDKKQTNYFNVKNLIAARIKLINRQNDPMQITLENCQINDIHRDGDPVVKSLTLINSYVNYIENMSINVFYSTGGIQTEKTILNTTVNEWPHGRNKFTAMWNSNIMAFIGRPIPDSVIEEFENKYNVITVDQALKRYTEVMKGELSNISVLMHTLASKVDVYRRFRMDKPVLIVENDQLLYKVKWKGYVDKPESYKDLDTNLIAKLISYLVK